MEVKENPKYYLNPISEDSVEVAEDFFSIEKNETVLVSDSTTIRLYICLFGGAGMIYERFNDNCNIMEQSGKTGTLRYELQKLVMDKVKVYTGILQKHIGDKIQFCLDLYAEDVRFKYVTTTIFFVLALVSFRFAKVSTVFAWISAVSMEVALVFSVISLCRFFYDIVIFMVGGCRKKRDNLNLSFLEAGASEVFYKKTEISKELTIDVIKQLKTNELMKRVVRYVISNTVLIFFIKLMTFSVFIVVFKYMTTLLLYDLTPMDILINPFLITLSEGEIIS